MTLTVHVYKLNYATFHQFSILWMLNYTLNLLYVLITVSKVKHGYNELYGTMEICSYNHEPLFSEVK
jgi:hypothetical protein